MGQLRVAKTKVRTGCRTCKKRRVKCDEQKPECRRCVSGGRLCEGYEVVAQRQISPSTQRILLPIPRNDSPQTMSSASARLFSPVSSLPGASPEEIYYFEYFCKHTAPTLCGPFASPLFERFVLQLGRREPLIRHAATALAARTVLNQEDSGFALTQYGKSIALMRSNMTTSNKTPDSQRLALVACVLFVAFEIAQRRFAETAMHLEQGLNMLVNVRYGGHLPEGWDVDDLDTSDEGPGLDGELLRNFDRLDIQSSVLRTTKSKLRSDPREAARKTPRRFSSLEQARRFLDGFMRTRSAFTTDVRGTASPMSVADTCRLQEQQAGIRRQLHAWNAAFRQYKLPHVPLRMDIPSPPDAGVRACLEAMAVSNSILLETAMSDGRECVFDSFTSEFQMIIDLAEISRSHPRATTSQSMPSNSGAGFHIHIAYMPAVYVTALKCRNPYIRRRAIDLLESSSHREGMMDGRVGARLLQHVCELEESGYEGVFAAEDIPETARLHDVLFNIEDREGGVMTSYKRRDFEGEYGEPGACWIQWTDRVQVWLESMEESHY